MTGIDDVRAGVAEVWGRVLRLDGVPDDANFFELGGSSLAAIHVVSLLKERYDVALDVTDVFENDDLSALAELVHTRLPGGP